MDASVVVSTLERHDVIEQCIWSLLMQEDIRYEIIVVDGSPDDRTEAIAHKYEASLRYLRINERNLSYSRNVGIAAAAGEFVAFIDDDAFAHPRWLHHLAQRYSDPLVGAVGGFTRAARRPGWQVRGTLCDRWGDAYSTEIVGLEDDFAFPGSPLYPSLLGTNSSFRVSALRRIEGFDHAFAYFLDETDVCLRLIDAGYLVAYTPDAVVFHEMHRSALRTPRHYPRSLRLPARSKAYFIQRHGQAMFGAHAAAERIVRYVEDLRVSNSWFESEGIMTVEERVRLDAEVVEGIREGIALASDPTTLSGGLSVEFPDACGLPHEERLMIPSRQAADRVAIVCRSLPPASVGGIARWYQELAQGLAAAGLEVHVFSEARESHGVRLVRQGLWIHFVDVASYDDLGADVRRLLDGPGDQIRWSVAAALAALSSGFDFNVGLAPIWDAEGIGMELLCPWPSVISLHTTHALARPWKPDWQRPAFQLAHVRRMEDLENLSLELSAAVIANSRVALEAVSATYAADISQAVIIPHGIRCREESEAPLHKWDHWQAEPLLVTFLGRLEKRKGFPEALAAAQAVAQPGKVEFDFIGEGPSDPESTSALFALSAGASLESGSPIRLRGQLTDDEVAQHLLKTHVVLMPSHFESFGLVAAEALEAGCLLIIPKSSAMHEYFGHYPAVIGIESVDPARIEEALLSVSHLVPNPGRATRESQLRLKEEFATSKVAALTAALLREVGALE